MLGCVAGHTEHTSMGDVGTCPFGQPLADDLGNILLRAGRAVCSHDVYLPARNVDADDVAGGRDGANSRGTRHCSCKRYHPDQTINFSCIQRRYDQSDEQRYQGYHESHILERPLGMLQLSATRCFRNKYNNMRVSD